MLRQYIEEEHASFPVKPITLSFKICKTKWISNISNLKSMILRLIKYYGFILGKHLDNCPIWVSSRWPWIGAEKPPWYPLWNITGWYVRYSRPNKDHQRDTIVSNKSSKPAFEKHWSVSKLINYLLSFNRKWPF